MWTTIVFYITIIFMISCSVALQFHYQNNMYMFFTISIITFILLVILVTTIYSDIRNKKFLKN